MEKLIMRIRQRILFGQSREEIREALINEFSEAEIYLAFKAAKILEEA